MYFPSAGGLVQAVGRMEPQLLVYLGNSMRTEESTHTFARGRARPPPGRPPSATLCLPSSRSYHRVNSKRSLWLRQRRFFVFLRHFFMLKRVGWKRSLPSGRIRCLSVAQAAYIFSGMFLSKDGCHMSCPASETFPLT